MELLDNILSFMTALAVIIPLVTELVKYVRLAVKEKNWSSLLDLVIGYMEIAEDKFDTGAAKKDWVMSMIEQSADTINYDIDMACVSKLIDRLCEMSNTINASIKKINADQ